MKLKEFKKSAVWSVADCVRLYGEDDKEIEITSETQRGKIYNKEVVDHETEISDGIATLSVWLK